MSGPARPSPAQPSQVFSLEKIPSCWYYEARQVEVAAVCPQHCAAGRGYRAALGGIHDMIAHSPYTFQPLVL